ncbi:MAG: DEAD/DEAH box helicase [Phycisphaerales bacterium]
MTTDPSASVPPPLPPHAPQPPTAQPGSPNGAADPTRDANVLTAENKVDIFDRSITFHEMGLRSSVLKGTDELKFVHPTKIQSLLIPHLLKGKDMLGQARTGTGKTGAFGLPILNNADKETPFQALVMVPTRELCVQVAEELRDLGQYTPIRAVAVYGGERMQKQVDALRKGPQIVVSTPGRLMDMIERGHMHLRNVKFAVLDEVDRMLDIGFRDDIRRILSQCPKDRQTVFVSATISPDIERLARQFCKGDAEKVIAVTGGPTTASTIKQYYCPVNHWDKRRLLAHLLLHEEPALTVVFCKMKSTVDKVCEYLHDKKIEAHAMHGDKSQAKRNQVIEKLHAGKLSVVVASDLVSRGIDVENISHVINYDMPEDPEVYVHRVGRTARIGREGVAYSFVTPEDGDLLTQIEQLINAEIPRLYYPEFKPSDRQGGSGGPGGPNGGPGSAPPPPPPPPQAVNRLVATVNPLMPDKQDVDTSKFPGGIVPTKLPPNRMGGRMKTSRGLRGG